MFSTSTWAIYSTSSIYNNTDTDTAQRLRAAIVGRVSDAPFASLRGYHVRRRYLRRSALKHIDILMLNGHRRSTNQFGLTRATTEV